MSRFLDEAKTLLSVSSVSPAGTDGLVHQLGRLMEAAGLQVKTQAVRARQMNVIGILGSPLVDRKTKKGLLLLAPLDTAEPGRPDDWTHTGGVPFGGTAKDERLYGSGACDGKLAFLCMLTALRKFRDKALRSPVYLVGTCGEKLGALGSRYLLESWAVNPKAVVLGKPTQMKVATASPSSASVNVSIKFQTVERGVKEFTRRIHITSRGLTAPASHPEYGVHAIHELLRVVSEMMRPGLDVKWSLIEGGVQMPQVPDRAALEFFVSSQVIDDYKHHIKDVMTKPENGDRFTVELKGVGDTGMTFLPGQIMSAIRGACEKIEQESVRREFRQCLTQIRQESGHLQMGFQIQAGNHTQDLGGILADLDKSLAEWALQFPSFSIKFERVHDWPALLPSTAPGGGTLEGAALESLKAVGLPAASGTETDFPVEAGLFAMRGYESIVVGPGDFADASGRPNEHNSLDQLEGAIKFYESLILKVCE